MLWSPEPIAGTEDDVVLSRVGAFVVDYVLQVAALFGVGVPLAVTLRSEAVVYLAGIVVFIGYHVVFEGLGGQTPGKRLLGVVVVQRRTGEPIGMGTSVIRNLLRIVDGILHYAVGLVVMLVSERRQRIGDHVAGTVVVRAR